MKKNFNYIRKLNHILKTGIICILVGFVVFMLTAEPRIPGYKEYIPETINDGWVQLIHGEEKEIESVIDAIDVGGDVILQRSLPEILDDEILLFYSQNQEIKVYVDGELIYQFLMREYMEFFESPGNLWNEIPLDNSMSEKKIRVEISCETPRYTNQIGQMYITHNSGKIVVETKQSWFQAIVGFMILIFAVYGYIKGHRITDRERKRRIYLTADLYVWIGLWIMAECGSIDAILRRPLISYVVAMLALRVIPIVFVSVVLLDAEEYRKRLELARTILWGNLILSVVGQFVFGVSFLDTLVINNVLIMISGIICAIYFLQSILNGKKNLQEDSFFMCCVAIFVGAMIDLAVYTFYQRYTKGIGIGTCIVMLIFTGIHLGTYMKKKREAAERVQELENELDIVKYSVLAKQMNAHFLNNTLNSISALCKTDPREADRAIKILAKYLRMNMYLIEREEAISFQKEMELVEYFLQIEEIRFEDRFTVFMDIQFNQFNVPTLSIQPLIENAFVHGIRSKLNGGWIKITSVKEGNMAKVCIEDNGVGFVLEALEKGDSLGIKNMQKRMKLIVNGEIKIYSELNKGSKITILVPIEENYRHSEVEHEDNIRR